MKETLGIDENLKGGRRNMCMPSVCFIEGWEKREIIEKPACSFGVNIAYQFPWAL